MESGSGNPVRLCLAIVSLQMIISVTYHFAFLIIYCLSHCHFAGCVAQIDVLLSSLGVSEGMALSELVVVTRKQGTHTSAAPLGGKHYSYNQQRWYCPSNFPQYTDSNCYSK